MNSKYLIRAGAGSQRSELEIDKERFEKLELSKLTLSNALAIEEKYEIVINNFVELEQEATNISISEMVYYHVEYKSFFDDRTALNTRLINLLTAVRLYTDQLSSHISECVPSTLNTNIEVKNYFSVEYDSNFYYRFMEALRNHVQHSGIPVHKISTSSKRVSHVSDTFLEYSISFFSQKNLLIQDGGFKKQVIEEMPEEVNLRVATRSYIEAISRIHKQARGVIEEIVAKSRNDFDNVIRDYMVVHEGVPIALYAYEFKGTEKVREVLIQTEWDDVRRKLVEKNKELVNLGKRYISSTPKP